MSLHDSRLAVRLLVLFALAGCHESTTQPPAATALGFQVQPTDRSAGAPFSIEVLVVDASGRTVTSATGSVRLALEGAGGATLLGTVIAQPQGGIATFTDLSIQRAGSRYRLVASADGLAAATSSDFAVTAGTKSKLAFLTQPGSVTAGQPISPALGVAFQDAFGNTVSSATDPVTVGLGNNPASGALSGTAVVTAVGGVATFSTLSLNRAGTGYTLVASSGGMTGASTNPFAVASGPAAVLALVGGGGQSGSAGDTLAQRIVVQVNDAGGNGVAGTSVGFAVASGGGSVSPASATTDAQGRATVKWTLGPAVGEQSIAVSSPGIASLVVTATQTPRPATRLAFVTVPVSTPGGAPIAPAVVIEARDATGARASGFAGTVTIGLGAHPGSLSALSGTLSVAAVGGAATFSDVRLSEAGTYTLTASAPGLVGASSAQFEIGSFLVVWTRRGSGAWSDPGNWSPRAPQAGDSVVIGKPDTTFTVMLDASVSPSHLMLGTEAGGGRPTLLVPNRTDSIRGALSVGANGTLRVEGRLLVEQGFTNLGKIELFGDWISVKNGAITNRATIESGTTRIAAEVDNQGEIVGRGRTLIALGSAHHTNRGRIVVSNGFDRIEVAGGTFTNRGALEIGAYNQLFLRDIAFDYEGGALTAPTGAVGSLEIVDTQVRLIADWTGTTVPVNLQPGSVVSGSGSFTIPVGGKLSLQGQSTMAARLINRGLVSLSRFRTGGDVTFAAGVVNEGTIEFACAYASQLVTVSGGMLTNASTGTIRVSGAVSGPGCPLHADVVNQGTLDLGIDDLAIDGSLAVSGTLQTSLWTTGRYGRVVVSGSATLGGLLKAGLADGFTGVSGDVFTVMTYGSRTGAFATTDLPPGITAATNATTVVLAKP